MLVSFESRSLRAAIAITLKTTLRLALTIGLAGTTQVAFAQAAPPSAHENLASAEALYQAGKAAMARKDYATACKAFEDSLALDESLGIRLNLARCNEERGRVSTAWGLFRDVEVRARKAGPSQEARANEAAQRAAALEPRISRVVIMVLPSVRAAAPDIAVTIDGRPASEVLWQAGIPVDIGSHELVATAAGKLPYRAKFKIDDEGKSESVQVVGFVDAPPEPVKVVPVAPPVQDSRALLRDVEAAARVRTQRTLGYVITSTGGVATAAGIVFGSIAFANVTDANRCTAGARCTVGPTEVPGNVSQDVVDSSLRARSHVTGFGTAANIAIPVGLAITGLGLYLLIDSLGGTPKKTTTGIRVVPNGIQF
jgi:hypothetical protein